MRIIRLLLTILITCSAISLRAESLDSSFQEPIKIGKFSDLLKRVEASDTTVDFVEFRLAFSRSRHYKPYRDDLDKLEEEMRFEFKMGHFSDATAAARKILKKEYINIQAHHLCALASDSIGDTSNARYHHYVALRLLQSILDTGDGQSQESAYFVVLVSEEYALLNALGYQVHSQSVATGEDGRTYDRFEVTDPETNEERAIYFDITMAYSSLKNRF